MLAEAKALLAQDPARARDLALRAGDGLEARFVSAAALRRCGDADAALNVLAGITATRAWGVHYERGAALSMVGRGREAIGALQMACSLNPAAAIAAHALLGELTLAGEPVPQSLLAARASILRAGQMQSVDRNDPCWLRLLADAARTKGAEDDAEDLLRAAFSMASRMDVAAMDLAALLESQQRGPETLELAAPLAQRHPQSAMLHALLAAAHLHCGHAEAALAALNAAMAIDPDNAGLIHARGHALRVAGNPEAAIAAYRRALVIAPDRAEPWWSMANLQTMRFSAEDRMQMEAGIAAEPPLHEAVHLHFALGRAALTAGECDVGMEHFAAANAIRHAQASFDIDAHQGFVAQSLGLDADFFAAREGWGDPRSGPVFVVGMPRAGSTLVEQVLASHPEVEGLSELPDLTILARKMTRELIAQGRATDRVSAMAAMTEAEARSLGASYLDRVAPRRSGSVLFLDKAPGNVLNIALIRLALPSAKIIDVRRDPMACCFSLYVQDFAAGQAYSYNQTTLGRYYRHYCQLADHFASLPESRVLMVRYEDMVDDLERETRRMLAHCGLPFAPQCLRFFENPRVVRTISSEQVRQPIYRAGLDRWKACAPWLGELSAALGQPEPNVGG
jgi:tetratricopeptide (TPR) repeat protein